MRAAWLTAIGLGIALAACAGNHPIGGPAESPGGSMEGNGQGGTTGSSDGRHHSPDGSVVVVAPVAGDASAADGVARHGASDAGASDGGALEHGLIDGGSDAGTPCVDAAACGRVPTSIAIGGDGPWQACALFNDGTVECWTNGVAADAPETTPVRVPGLAGATAISVGGENACALLGDGTVTCWVNTAGNQYAAPGRQLTTPAAVPGLAGVTALAVGELHSCAVVAGGAVKCWGVNNVGELGDGTTVDSATPVTVSVLDGAVAVAVGQFHSCALRVSDEIQCWGDNEQGYLGDGTAVSATTPVTASDADGASAISASGGTTCALLPGGGVSCWGDLFQPDMTSDAPSGGVSTYAFVPTPAPGLTGATAIAAGGSYGCAVAAEKIVCWGADQQDQLGDGQPKTLGLPVTVSGALPSPIAVAATLDRTCALLADGRVACWGARTYFSTGSTTLDLTPVFVSGL
jgi:alpha-tubulin suppressor-like RCC1 family protein